MHTVIYTSRNINLLCDTDAACIQWVYTKSAMAAVFLQLIMKYKPVMQLQQAADEVLASGLQSTT